MPVVELNSRKIHYDLIEVEKSDDRYLLLFLHEALGSIPQWREFPKELCEKLGLNGLVYERQGHGLSSPLTNPRTETYLHDYAFDELPLFLDSVVNKKIKLILVGHSDGGTIALLYASKFPGKVHSVITMAAHVVNEVETIRGIGPAVEAYQSGKLDKLKTYHGAKTEDLFCAWANTWQSPEFKQWNILADLGTVTVPVFAIQGEQDQYGTAKQLQLIQENVGSFCQTQMLSSCGHHPHYEQSETVKEEIKIFLTKMNFSEGKGLI